jgi:hypothetical protein
MSILLTRVILLIFKTHESGNRCSGSQEDSPKSGKKKRGSSSKGKKIKDYSGGSSWEGVDKRPEVPEKAKESIDDTKDKVGDNIIEDSENEFIDRLIRVGGKRNASKNHIIIRHVSRKLFSWRKRRPELSFGFFNSVSTPYTYSRLSLILLLIILRF